MGWAGRSGWKGPLAVAVAVAGPSAVGQQTRLQLRSQMSSGRKRKAQVTSFNSGVGTLGWDLGIWWGSQAWGVGLRGHRRPDL